MKYPAYMGVKPSGHVWAGDIPSHWSVLPLKRVARIRYGLGQPPQESEQGLPLLRATNISHGRITPDGLLYVDPSDVPPGREAELRAEEILVVRSGAYTGDSAIVPIEYTGAIAGYDMVVTVRRGCPSFMAWEMLSPEVNVLQFGLFKSRAAQPHLNAEELGETAFIVPPYDEQKEIASFLDHKTALIDNLIAKRKRQIELLQEQRTALISQTVTKGLNPDVPMMDSGVEAMGRVPMHWQISRLMYLTPPTRQIMYGIVLPGPNVEGGIPIVKSGDCNPEKLRLNRLNRTTPEIEAPYARARLEPRDIVYAIRGSIGASAMVPDELRGANLTQDAARIAPAKKVNPHWLLFAVQSKSTWAQLEAGIVGATVKGVNICDLKRPYIVVPPVEEQVAIAKYLMGKVASMRDLVEKTGKTIEKLKEYRQSLISAAVTGKIDVRSFVNKSDSRQIEMEVAN